MRIFPQSPWRALVLGVLIVGVIVGCPIFLQMAQVGSPSLLEKEVRTDNEAFQMATAIRNYEAEYLRPPDAGDNAGIIRELTKDNPRGIQYLEPRADELNDKGEMVDAWGVPFLISVDQAGRPTVISPTKQHATHWHYVSAAAPEPPLAGMEERATQKRDDW